MFIYSIREISICCQLLIYSIKRVNDMLDDGLSTGQNTQHTCDDNLIYEINLGHVKLNKCVLFNSKYNILASMNTDT
jgi:hypothetical protein